VFTDHLWKQWLNLLSDEPERRPRIVGCAPEAVRNWPQLQQTSQYFAQGEDVLFQAPVGKAEVIPIAPVDVAANACVWNEDQIVVVVVINAPRMAQHVILHDQLGVVRAGNMQWRLGGSCADTYAPGSADEKLIGASRGKILVLGI